MNANAEADDLYGVSQLALWIITTAFSAAIAVTVYLNLAAGWSILIVFVGMMSVLSICVLPILRKLDAGRAYLEQAATIAYRHTNNIN